MMDVTQKRRAMVQALLSPSSPGSVSVEERAEVVKKQLKGPGDDDVLVQQCSLCLCSDESQFSTNNDGPSSFVLSVLKQSSASEEESLTFCDFCCSQLQNLTRLKREMDSMASGLRAIIGMPTHKGETLVVDKNGGKILGQAHGGHRNLTAVETVLKNSDLLRMILTKVNREYPYGRNISFRSLRLVCRDFNDAILTLSHPPPIKLDLNAMFPDVCEDAEECLHPTPIPVEDIPTLQSNDLCRRVGICFETNDDCQHAAVKYEGELGDFLHPLALETITFMNFTSVYGTSIKCLKLSYLTEEYIPPIAVTIDRHCPNLRDLSIQMYHCGCKGEAKDAYDFTFSTKENLKTLELKLGSMYQEYESGTCLVMYQMAKAIIEASPNLQRLVCRNHMFFDLSNTRKLTQVGYYVWPGKTSFSRPGLVNFLSSSATRLETLEIGFCNENLNLPISPETQAKMRLIPLPQLRNLDVSFMQRFNFGSTLAECIFSPLTSRLQTLTIGSGDQDALQNFLLLIQDNSNHFINQTVKKLELRSREYGISNIAHLAHLKTAFPNLKVLKLRGGVGRKQDGNRTGSENLRNVFTALSRWKELQELELKVNFGLRFFDFVDVLGSLGKDYWKKGCIRKMRFEVEHSLFSEPTNYSYYRLGDMKVVLLSLKCMENVSFAKFVMPATLTQTLVRFISENDLPISFID